MTRRSLLVAASILICVCPLASAQLYKAPMRVPNAKALTAAEKLCTDVFANLKAGKTEEIASWVIQELGYVYSEADRITRKNDFKSKLDLVLAGPPASPYGSLDGYDLIDEAYLPGTDRYFRYVYMSYHQKAPLIWEFRFYVQPDGKVTLHNVTWSDKNPFEYMSTSDMRLPSWTR